MVEESKCVVCNNTGYVNNEPCPTCFGQGITPILYDYARVFKILSAHTTLLNKMSSNLDDIMVKLDV